MTATTMLASCATAVPDCQDTVSTDLTVPFIVVAALVVAAVVAIVLVILRRTRRR